MKTIKFDLQSPMDTPFGGACSDFFHMPSCGFLCGKLEFSCKLRFKSLYKNDVYNWMYFYRVCSIPARRYQLGISFSFRRVCGFKWLSHFFRANLRLLKIILLIYFIVKWHSEKLDYWSSTLSTHLISLSIISVQFKFSMQLIFLGFIDPVSPFIDLLIHLVSIYSR